MTPTPTSGVAPNVPVATALPGHAFWLFNSLFGLDGGWHIWAITHDQSGPALISKFLLCLLMALMLKRELGQRVPATILVAVLFCLTGDVLLQPLDMNYADMSGSRPGQFVLGVVCFCLAYGHLARYFLDINPDWRNDLRRRPVPAGVNVMVTLLVLGAMTLYNRAPVYLLPVLWMYSPVVVGMATLTLYLHNRTGLLPFLALVAGCNALVFSDTLIGLTVFVKMTMPWQPNPVWILSTYMLGIGLVFNAIIFIEKRARTDDGAGDFH